MRAVLAVPSKPSNGQLIDGAIRAQPAPWPAAPSYELAYDLAGRQRAQLRYTVAGALGSVEISTHTLDGQLATVALQTSTRRLPGTRPHEI